MQVLQTSRSYRATTAQEKRDFSAYYLSPDWAVACSGSAVGDTSLASSVGQTMNYREKTEQVVTAGDLRDVWEEKTVYPSTMRTTTQSTKSRTLPSARWETHRVQSSRYGGAP